MSLDSIARASADALLDASRGAGSEDALDELVRTSRRRSQARVVAAAACVALAVAAGLLVSAPGRERTSPATRDKGPLIVTVGGAYNHESVILRDEAGSRVFDQFDGGPRLRFVRDVAVEREGGRVAVLTEHLLQVVAADGTLLWAEPCRKSCLWVRWTPEDEVVLTEYAGSRAPLVNRSFARDGLAKGEVSFPRGTDASGTSPEGDRLVGVEETGTGEDATTALVVMDRDGSDREGLPGTALPPGTRIYEVAWSPDGRHLGYLTYEPVGRRSDITRYRLMVSTVEGTDAHEVAFLGKCLCGGWSMPGFAWSPDGQSLLVHSLPNSPQPGTHVLTLDGELKGPPLAGETPLAWGS